jgi:D-arabinitol 2-dehydrogenase
MAINVEGSFYCAREAAKDMMRREAAGSIIMIGSMSGSVVNIPQPQAPYNASKAAVLQLARSLAVEWATRHIRVNVISPGYMLVSCVFFLRSPPAYRLRCTLTLSD